MRYDRISHLSDCAVRTNVKSASIDSRNGLREAQRYGSARFPLRKSSDDLRGNWLPLRARTRVESLNKKHSRGEARGQPSLNYQLSYGCRQIYPHLLRCARPKIRPWREAEEGAIYEQWIIVSQRHDLAFQFSRCGKDLALERGQRVAP